MAARPISRQYKVCVIGDGYVGKTSIRRRYLGKIFKSSYIATIGVDFAQKSVTVDGNQVLLVIWDIAGQPLWQGLRKRYYEGASGLVLVYSVIERASFDSASKWLVEAHGFMQKLPPLVVVGNKIDLRSTVPPEQTVTREEGEAFTKRFSEGMNTEAVFIETSAATGEMIDEAFAALTNMMIEVSNRRMPGYVQKAKVAQLHATPVPESSPTTSAPILTPISSSAPVQTQPLPVQTMPTAAAVTTSPEPIASASKVIATQKVEEKRPPQPAGFVASPRAPDVVHAEAAPAGVVSPATERMPEVDAFLSSVADVPLLEDNQIKESIADLMNLQSELKKTESALASTSSALDADLLNLRNSVHVKRMMYEALQQQIRLLKDEWGQVYDEYQKTDRRKKTEIEERTRQIDDLKKRIGRVKESIEKRARELQSKGATR